MITVGITYFIFLFIYFLQVKQITFNEMGEFQKGITYFRKGRR